MNTVRLRLTDRQHRFLRSQLFPGDALEAVALALCGRRAGEDHCLMVNTVVPVPYDDCQRKPDEVTWKTQSLVPLLAEAMEKNLAILRIHSHPNSYPWFSDTDDESDARIF